MGTLRTTGNNAYVKVWRLRQTKGIMVFLILANYGGACLQ